MRLIDTHLHLVYRDRLAYVWLADEPGLNGHDSSYELYAAEAHPLGVTDCLHMEVDVRPEDIERETELIRSLAGDPVRRIRGAISSCRPESADFVAHLDRVSDDPFLRGFRRILHVMPDDLTRTPLFRDNIRRLAGTGLTFDICVRADQLPIAAELIDACPDVSFVLDHCGGGSASRPEIFAGWKTGLAEVARRPNVTAKVSGVIGTVKDGWTVADLKPVVETTISTFGWDRVVWASDWPWSAQRASLTDWIKATHVLVAGASEAEKEKLFHLNAARVYRID